VTALPEGNRTQTPVRRARGRGRAPSATHCTSFTCRSGGLRTGLPVAAWTAFGTLGVTTQIVASPTPPRKS